MNLDLGPCFCMKGHPRRDPDVILRLSKSTTEDLSDFIGFRSLSSVKMFVFDKIQVWHDLNCLWMFYFDSGIILGLFSDRKSIFRDRNNI